MTGEELEKARHAHWNAVAAAAGLSESGVRQFVATLGLTGLAPLPALPLPTLSLLGAGHDEARAGRAIEALLEEALAAGSVIELRLWHAGAVFASPALVPYIVASVGAQGFAREFRREANQRKLSFLAAEVYELLPQEGPPLGVGELRTRLGSGGTADLAVERALHELAGKLAVIRRGNRDGEPVWGPLPAELSGPASAAMGQIEAATALVSHRLSAMLLETEETLGEFFIPIAPRNRVHAALLGLVAGHQVTMDSLDGRQAYRLAETRMPAAER